MLASLFGRALMEAFFHAVIPGRAAAASAPLRDHGVSWNDDRDARHDPILTRIATVATRALLSEVFAPSIDCYRVRGSVQFPKNDTVRDGELILGPPRDNLTDDGEG